MKKHYIAPSFFIRKINKPLVLSGSNIDKTLEDASTSRTAKSSITTWVDEDKDEQRVKNVNGYDKELPLY